MVLWVRVLPGIPCFRPGQQACRDPRHGVLRSAWMRTPGQEEDGKKMGRKIIIILKKTGAQLEKSRLKILD